MDDWGELNSDSESSDGAAIYEGRRRCSTIVLIHQRLQTWKIVSQFLKDLDSLNDRRLTCFQNNTPCIAVNRYCQTRRHQIRQSSSVFLGGMVSYFDCPVLPCLFMWIVH
ncbi:hypothetical protein PanWU01x14_250880 [Parasponia andersonii]|uniref:Uncharacterized protein n=1 Tax=Parasponia andersonii TaxID=3476 RepID=A0A2P5BCR3_PARAD|nr:hypothetical protein PanWU01x14_250880 [Parasponia andersonii]